MDISELRKRLTLMDAHTFKKWVLAAFHASFAYSSITEDAKIGDKLMDFSTKTIPTTLHREECCCYYRIVHAARVGLGAIEEIRSLKSEIDDDCDIALIVSGHLTYEAKKAAKEFKIEVLDARTLGWMAGQELLINSFGEACNLPPIYDSRTHSLIEKLEAIHSGHEQALEYQQLVADVMHYLFCPPLELPQYEVPDRAERNRRDVILENAAIEGFWAHMRVHYNADYVVVDAKNYTEAIGKRPILDLAHYLKPHGCGMFGMIVCRAGPDDAAKHAIEQIWIDSRKLIIVLSDNDIKDMIFMKMEGGIPEEIIRNCIADFRIGF